MIDYLNYKVYYFSFEIIPMNCIWIYHLSFNIKKPITLSLDWQKCDILSGHIFKFDIFYASTILAQKQFCVFNKNLVQRNTIGYIVFMSNYLYMIQNYLNIA